MNNRLKSRRSVITSIIVVLLVVAGIITAYFVSFWGPFIVAKLEDSPIKKNTYIEQAGEKITIQYITAHYNSSDPETHVSVFSKQQNTALTYYQYSGNYVPPKITPIYASNNLVAYEWKTGAIYFITYKTSTSYVKAFSQYQIESNDFKDANLLYPVAKQQFDTKRWECINLFGELLLKCNDTDVKATLQRYARGLFTDQETLINQHSTISSTDVQQNAAKLLSQY